MGECLLLMLKLKKQVGIILRVLRIASDVYPIVIGGYTIHVHNMAKTQEEKGVYNVVAAVDSKSSFSRENKKNANYDLKLFKPTIELFGNRISLSQLRFIWKNRKKFDIIHAHSHLFFSTNFAAFCKLFGSSPLVLTNHGLFSQTAPIWLQHFFLKTFGKFTCKKADKIICYTEEEKNELYNYLKIKKNKVYVIHNGINLNKFSTL